MAPRKSKKKKGVATGEGTSNGTESDTESEVMLLDRFTALPDYVSHHILSSLTIADLARVCVVSKTCRQRSLSTPSLNFDQFPMKYTSSCDGRLELLSYLERFLFFRGDNKIQSFRFNWERHYRNEDGTPCRCTTEHDRLSTWINNAVRCKVEALDLKMRLSNAEEAPFPCGVFLCGSLKSLVVNMNFTLMRTPSAFSSNLNRLELKSVGIEDEGFFKWISSSCKFLQELNLNHFNGTKNITIENSSSLKRVQLTGVKNTSHLNLSGEKLERISIIWYFESPSDKSLSISAPNLKHFTWEGSLAGRTTLGKFQSIKSATLFLKPEADALDNVYGVLSRVCKANILMLGESTFKGPFGEGSMPAPIYDTLCMGLRISSFTDDLIPAMASLFKGYPKLNILTLSISSNQPQDDSVHNTSRFNVEYWKLQNLALIHQLRKVRLELYNESNGIDLARYILECAPRLLKMDINCPTANLEEVRGTLLKSKKVSSAPVVFSEK